MEEITFVKVVIAFLEELGYRSATRPSPGEYVYIRATQNPTYIDILTKHQKWDVMLDVFPNGEVGISVGRIRPPDPILLPKKSKINLADPKSFDILKRFL